MENREIQERTGKLVRPAPKVLPGVRAALEPKDKRENTERDSLDPEAPQDYQDPQGPAPGTALHFWTWRAQDSQTWKNCGVLVVTQAPQALLVLLVHQWH